MSFDLFLRCPCISKRLGLPKQYKPLNVLGKGAYGFVVRCKKKDTNEIVAVKISNEINTLYEIHMMRNLMSHNFDQHNIVRFLDSFSATSGLALVMEELDITLLEYLNMSELDLMPLSDIRHIIKQVAVALDALKSIRVIHGDIKPDNIMMVDHRTRPFRVKVIDFGLAMPISEAKRGMMLQHRWYRAPEVILGVPFTEAIDMWSLGCVMAMMFIRKPLFRGWNNYEVMECIVHHCGLPPDHLLNKGLYTKNYFSKTETNKWTKEKRMRPNNLNRCYEAQIKERLDNKNEDELLEAFRCLDLQRAMLRVDPAERITPAEVLVHPFISEIHISMTSRPASWTCTSDREDPVTAQEERETTNLQPAHRSPSPTIPPSRVIYVRPATAENTLRLEDHESLDSFQAGLKNTSESTVTFTENDTTLTEDDSTVSDTSTLTSEDITYYGKKQLPQSPPPVTDLSSKKKKKKNCFRCFSWMKKTFCSCVTCVDDD